MTKRCSTYAYAFAVGLFLLGRTASSFVLSSREAFSQRTGLQLQLSFSRLTTARHSTAIRVAEMEPAASNSPKPGVRVTPAEFQNHVAISRAFVVVALALLTVFWNQANEAVQAFYTRVLLTNPFFHHYSFEPILASTCFAVYIAMYAVTDYWIPALWKYRIQRTDSMVAWQSRLRDALTFEVPLYLGLWIPFGGLVRARKVQAATSLGLVVQEVLAALFIYDTIFYVGHGLLHRVSFLYNSIHKKHHAMATVRAGDSVRHSFLDGVFDVVCAVAALMILKANALSRSVFNIVAIGLIVEAHCGMNLPWSLANIVPFRLVAGPVVHDKHHSYGRLNFSKFFTHWDKLMGTFSASSSSSENGVAFALSS